MSAFDSRSESTRSEKITTAKKRKSVIAIAASVGCACIAFAIVLTTVIIPGSKYRSAVELIDQKDYEGAYALLRGLSYEDSAEKARDLLKEHPSVVQVGDTITFGAYEQDNDTANGKEAIEWIILAKEKGSVLVISKYALEHQPYHASYTGTTWETCSLRSWLNDTFLSSAFSPDEQERIATTKVSADRNPKYDTDPGNATNDKIFLLSIAEAEKYFSSNSARRCSATAYAEAQVAYRNFGSGNCWWWLRSPGGYFQVDHTRVYNLAAALVLNNGSIPYSGAAVDVTTYAVRPALWMALE